jgi:hypothetical protein
VGISKDRANAISPTLDAYVYQHTVQLYDGVALLVTHPRARRPGERHTKLEHYPEEKSFYLVHTREYCQAQAGRIGPCCAVSRACWGWRDATPRRAWRRRVLAPCTMAMPATGV